MTDAQLLILIRWAVLIGWLFAMFRLLPRTISAFRKTALPDDPLYAVMFAFAALSFSFAVRYVVLDVEPVNAGERAWLLVSYVVTIALQFVIVRFVAWGRAGGR